MVNLANTLVPQVKEMPQTELKINSYGFFEVTDETIISYYEDGSILSKYGDDTWKFETKKETLFLYFNIEFDGILEAKKKQIKRDLKSLQFAILHTPSSKKSQVKSGFNRQKKANNALRAMMKTALEQGFDFKFIFTGNYNHYLEDVLTKEICKGLNSMLAAQAYFKGANLDVLDGISPVRKPFEDYFSLKSKELDSDTQQTLAIPERIYLLALEKIEQDLNAIDEGLLGDVISELTKNAENPLYGLERKEQTRAFKLTDEYHTLLKQHNRTKLPRNYDFGVPTLSHAIDLPNVFKRLDGSLSIKNFAGLREYLTQVQKKCFRALVAYSGGRLNDISYLTSNAFVVHEVGGQSFPLLYGEVQKGVLTDDDVEFWVTNEVGQKAFNIAKKISDFIYKTAVNKNYKGVSEEEKLLFPSKKVSRLKRGKHTVFLFGNTFFEMEIDGSVIDESDRIELMRLDPSLDLEREDVAEGYQWTFKTHQFRRSLSLYAMASGAVSLPSLRRQLRHLVEAMTLYYSGGSCAASNIIEKKGSFAKECAEAKSASTAIALHKFVASDEMIFGGMGRHLDKNQELKNIILDQDTTETRKMVERGELSYDETALGGCGETGNCDYRPFALMDPSHCTHCEKTYHKVSTMNKAIEVFEVSLQYIPLNTRQHKWRELQIQDLKQVRDSHLDQQQEQSND